jgi:hypothetical protein
MKKNNIYFAAFLFLVAFVIYISIIYILYTTKQEIGNNTKSENTKSEINDTTIKSHNTNN